MSSVTLSPGQAKVFDDVMGWHRDGGRTFTIAGYAGTGKSTLARLIAEAIDPVGTAYCAYTGKAANVLREKGCENAGTLHSWLYQLTDHNRSIIAQLEAQIEEAHKAGNFAAMDTLIATLEEKRRAFRKPKFELNMDSDLANAKLIIVDEYSMLPKKLTDDLERVGKKILYLGDPFQLPPVEGECHIKPDAFLTEIHRQALESPIIRASIDVREGRRLEYCDTEGFKFQPQGKVAADEYTMAEQVIVGRNKTRTAWNDRFRTLKGIDVVDCDGHFPRTGDKMICLKNNPELGLFNGQIGHCVAARDGGEDSFTLDFETNGATKYALPVWEGDVKGESQRYDGYNEYHRQLERFDYGYAITCHKSQGSEFDSVLIYNEPIGGGDDRKRWLYTAITRGKNKVTLVDPKGGVR